MSRRTTLAWLTLLVVGCSSPRTTLRLSIRAAAGLATVEHLRVLALVPGTAERATFQADLASRDLGEAPFVLELDVAEALEPREATVAVLGEASGEPVASGFVRVALGTATTHDVVLAPIAEGCDADADGFKPCAVKAACCSPLEAEVAADCDDAEARLWPFAEAVDCRTCDQVAACLAWEPDAAEAPDAIEPRPEPPPERSPEISPEAGDVVEPQPDLPEPPPDIAEPAPDIALDARPEVTCPCTAGPCCDGCAFKASTIKCEDKAQIDYVCLDGEGCGSSIYEAPSTRYCPGDAATCTGVLKAESVDLYTTCADDEACQAGSATCASPSECQPKACPADMVPVPAGPFWMGCDLGSEPNCAANEAPAHEVTTPSYCIDVFEVTNDRYKACWSTTCTAPTTGGDCVWNQAGKDGHPVNCVTWDQAQAFCEWDGKRLCSEAEWEKAARGGCELYTAGACKASEPRYPWGADCPASWGGGCAGEEWTDANAPTNCAESLCHDGVAGTAPVDAFSSYPSPYMTADQAGNVSEWLADCSHAGYDTDDNGVLDAPVDGSAWVTDCLSSGREVRGGSWASAYAYKLRASYRSVVSPITAPTGVGIRCCKSLP